MENSKKSWEGKIVSTRRGKKKGDSVVLSDCIANLSNARGFARMLMPYWLFRADLESKRLYRRWTMLQHRELNVLSAWKNRFRHRNTIPVANLGFLKAEEAFERGEASPEELGLASTELAKAHAWELMRAEDDLQPAYARAFVARLLEIALGFEGTIRSTENPEARLQGLRQFVRVLKHAGEVSRLMHWPDRADEYFGRAVLLAREARTRSQERQLNRMRS